MSQPTEPDRLLDHEYDGIQEYDNPLPRWWVATFWITIIFSVLYVLNLPVVGMGKGRVADYEADMAKAAELAAANDPLAGVTAATLEEQSRDQATLELGQGTYASMCSACHAADGGGGIGPNLTDGYWLHGAGPLEVFAIVNTGVPEKGMPAWGRTLKPDQLTAVTAYVLTLRGTTPATPKPPQGIPADSAAAAAPAPPSTD